MDFDWPLKKVWAGYLMPDELDGDECPACVNGSTDAAEWLYAVAYIIAELADDVTAEARGQQLHPWLMPLWDIAYNHAKGRPGPQFAEFADGIAPEVKGGMFGRDSWRMARALVAVASLPEDWGICPTCQGHASIERYEGQRADADAWKGTEPPTGEGWQMWETTSEGSPTSPVFASAEELAQWCAIHSTTFGDQRADAAEWLHIIRGEQFGVSIGPGMIAI